MGSDLLRTSCLKLGLITNGSIRMQSRKLQCLALSRLFDTILISRAEGISKPMVVRMIVAEVLVDVQRSSDGG
jgi:FMN phosphatase YigB (HAD superfamily)